MPNSLAYLVVFSYPLVAFAFFKLFRLPVAAATTIIAGYLLLPTKVELDLPMLPPLDKHTIPAIVTILCASYIGFSERARSRSSVSKLRNAPATKALNGWVPQDSVVIVLITVLVSSSFLTGLTNQHTVFINDKTLKAYNAYDTMALALGVIVAIVPMFIGRRLFAHQENQKILLGLFAFAGFLYAWLALLEIRIAPVVNMNLYNFFPHSFGQHIRAGGFRPVLFLQHGLWVAIFQAMAFVAALGAYRCSAPPFPRFVWLIFAFWIFLVLANSNSLGGFVLALFALPIALFLPPALQMLIATGIAIIVLFYPAFRAAGFIPVDTIMALANSIDPLRARSLATRLNFEEYYIEHAARKPWFGWGGFARHRPEVDTGKGTAVSDGYWVIVIAVGGWVRYLSEFGLITYGLLSSSLKRKSLQIGVEGAILMLMLAINLVDLIMNATSTPITWLLVGSILGRLELGSAGIDTAKEQAVDATRIGGRARHRGSFSSAGSKHLKRSTHQDQSGETQNSVEKNPADPAAPPADPERLEPTLGSRHTRFAQTHSRTPKQERKTVHRPPTMR